MDTTLNLLFLSCIIGIWLMLLYMVILSYCGYMYHFKISSLQYKLSLEIQYYTEWPSVTVMVPAHNEEVVIEKTVRSILSFDYPKDKLEIIIINDNSSDSTGDILEAIKLTTDKNLKIIHNLPPAGGKGKSAALNRGYQDSTGDIIAIYDADNTPNSSALKYLVYTLIKNPIYGAVVGKFRVRNNLKNMLTRFINIETLSYQWLAQGGRWFLFKLSTLPGTNFVVYRHLIDKIDGWDVKALTEDTEMSIRIYDLGYKICFMPLAITWEQEPETLNVWKRQRIRWIKGNIYVTLKYFPRIIFLKSWAIKLDIIYLFITYIVFFFAVIISDLIFILGIIGNIFNKPEFIMNLDGNYFIVWLLAYLLFILEISIILSFEKGENNWKNILQTAIMYFSYCQGWLILAILGFYEYFLDIIFKREQKWYKTKRFKNS